MTENVYCDRIDTDVTITTDRDKCTVDCPYFHETPKGPACKLVILGASGRPPLSPKRFAMTALKHLNMAFSDAILLHLGIGRGVSWHCKVHTTTDDE
jgi:hypothetical protein